MTENHLYRDTHYQDRTLRCCDCDQDFVFSAGEQAFFYSKRPPLADPKRCKACREFRQRTIHPPSDLDSAIARVRTVYGGDDRRGML